jgi:hypothetical protein
MTDKDLITIKKALMWIMKAMMAEIESLTERNKNQIQPELSDNVDLFISAGEQILNDLSYNKVFKDED